MKNTWVLPGAWGLLPEARHCTQFSTPGSFRVHGACFRVHGVCFRVHGVCFRVHDVCSPVETACFPAHELTFRRYTANTLTFGACFCISTLLFQVLAVFLEVRSRSICWG